MAFVAHSVVGLGPDDVPYLRCPNTHRPVAAECDHENYWRCTGCGHGVDILLEKYGPLALKKGQKPVTDALGHYVIGLTGGTSPRLSLHCHKASTKRTLVYYRGEGVYICGCCNADVTALRSEYKQRIEETQQPLKEEAKMEESNVEAEPQDPYVVHRKKPETVTKEQEGSAVVALGKNDPIQCPQCGVKASRLAYEPTVSGFVSRLLCPYCGKPIEEHQ